MPRPECVSVCRPWHGSRVGPVSRVAAAFFVPLPQAVACHKYAQNQSQRSTWSSTLTKFSTNENFPCGDPQLVKKNAKMWVKALHNLELSCARIKRRSTLLNKLEGSCMGVEFSTRQYSLQPPALSVGWKCSKTRGQSTRVVNPWIKRGRFSRNVVSSFRFTVCNNQWHDGMRWVQISKLQGACCRLPGCSPHFTS